MLSVGHHTFNVQLVLQMQQKEANFFLKQKHMYAKAACKEKKPRKKEKYL